MQFLTMENGVISSKDSLVFLNRKFDEKLLKECLFVDSFFVQVANDTLCFGGKIQTNFKIVGV